MQITQEFVNKTSVEEVHDGVLHAANININRHPLLNQIFSESLIFVFGVEIPQEVPTRVKEGVECVYFASDSFPRFRARGADSRFHKSFNMPERLAFVEDLNILSYIR